MLRFLAILLLGPALALGAVKFENDARPLDRTRPGASYADMLERIMPAVVSVRTAEVVPESVLRRFRGRIDPSKVITDSKTGETLVPRGLGSGTIVHPDGYVITNRHVVMLDDERVAQVAFVQLSDGRQLRARVLGVDDGTDVAVLKVAERNLPFARFADSDRARVGDVVFAIGNPLGVGMTVTSGIVSATGRSTQADLAFQDFIQTDAAINQGNSGGPLIDTEGRILGMNTMIRTDGAGGGNIGIGFSIPANLMLSVAHDLANGGKVVRGMIGVQGEDLPPDEIARLSLSRGAARITSAQSSGPAAKAGLRAGDVIVAVDGRPFQSWNDLRLAIARRKPGETVVLSFLREGRGSLAKVTIAERPSGN